MLTCINSHVKLTKCLHLFLVSVSKAFGSTHTLNPVSTNAGFCDERGGDDWGEDPKANSESDENESTLACLVSSSYIDASIYPHKSGRKNGQ